MERVMHESKINWIVFHILNMNSLDEQLDYDATSTAWCEENKKEIWTFVTCTCQDRAADASLLRLLTDPVHYTELQGEDMPTQIGIWLGMRIVNAYMSAYPNTTIKQLLEMNNYKQLINKSGYSRTL